MNNLLREVQFKTTRSAGSGGQNVNKVETKVSIYFDIPQSDILTEEQKNTLLLSLKNRINKFGILQLQCDSERSQYANKKKVKERFLMLIEKALKKKLPRIKSKRPKHLNEKRLKEKKARSEKKQLRKFTF